VSEAREEREGRVRAVVFLDGEYGDPEWHLALVSGADVVLAADGGARFLIGLGVVPDAVVGDFDSLDGASARSLEEAGAALVRHPVRKDVTDGELAVEEALRRGAGEVLLAGAVGALDHTLGHLAILRRLTARGVAARIVAPALTVVVLQAPTTLHSSASPGTRVSLAPLDGDAIVSLAGLEYPLDHGLLPADACLGLGNHVAASGAAVIQVHAGLVAAIVEADETPAARRSRAASE
jgi:thiamine pyrophosphokinase